MPLRLSRFINKILQDKDVKLSRGQKQIALQRRMTWKFQYYIVAELIKLINNTPLSFLLLSILL